jgi:type II secretion system protein N
MALRIARVLLKGLGYFSFFAVGVGVLTYLTFPRDHARRFLETELGTALGVKLKVRELDLSGIGGLELWGVVMQLKPLEEKLPPGAEPEAGKADEVAEGGAKAGEAKAEGRPNRRLRTLSADRITADVDIFSYLFSDELDLTADGLIQGGKVNGVHVKNKPGEAWEIEVGEVDGVELGAEQLVKGFLGFDLRGKLTGKALKLTWGKKPEELRGVIDIAVRDAMIIKPRFEKTPLGPIELSDVDLGELQLKVQADKIGEIQKLKRARGRAQEAVVIYIEDLGAEGRDIRVQFDASMIRIPSGAKSFKEAELDIHLAVQILDPYKEHETNRALLTNLLKDPKFKRVTQDGVFGVYCTGSIGKPDCGLERSRVKGFQTRKPKFQATAEEPEKPEAKPEKPDPKARPAPPGRPESRIAPVTPGDAAGARERAARERAEQRVRELTDRPTPGGVPPIRPGTGPLERPTFLPPRPGVAPVELPPGEEPVPGEAEPVPGEEPPPGEPTEPPPVEQPQEGGEGTEEPGQEGGEQPTEPPGEGGP